MLVQDGLPLSFCELSGIAVGWLERGSSYRTGITPANVTNRLAEILREIAWEPCHFMGYHHCDLGWCGTRQEAHSLERLIPVSIVVGTFSERVRREIESVSEHDAIIRRTLGRHRRRHHLPDPASPPRTPHARRLRLRLKLLAAHALDMLATAAQRSVRAAVNTLDPHPYQESWGTIQIDVGASNLFIPGPAQVYISPSMIFHYITRHQYRPPDDFCEAVLRSPAIGSREYFEALKPAVPEVAAGEVGAWVDQQLEWTRQVKLIRESAEKSRH